MDGGSININTPEMNNPTLYTLLKMGCSVKFPSGYILKGDPQNDYIDLYYSEGYMDGLQHLTKEGLKKSLQDEKNYVKQLK